MAGGEGTRLRPLTSNQPKPMVTVAGRPCMEHVLMLVRSHGITNSVATLAYMPQIIRGYFGEGSHLGIELDYSIEEVPAGTAGSVKLCEHYLDETFIVVSGDALTDIDLSAVIDFHKHTGAVATIALKRVANPLEFGVVITREDGRIERFLEKPGWGEVFSDTINTGIYVLEPEALETIPTDEAFDFSKDLFPRLLDAGAPLYGYVASGYWQDIGNIVQYQEANRDALDGKVELEIPGVRLRENVYVGEGALAENIERIQGPAVIGNYCVIDPTATIGRYTVLGNNVIAKEFSETHYSVVDANTYLGPRSQVFGAVVGKNCEVRAHAMISEGAVVGDECSIGGQSVIAPNVRVYPFKRVDVGAHVQRSLIWQPRGATSLFSGDGAVTGIVNVDITPETATRLAMAYGTTVSRHDRVVASRDPHPASRMIKRAMIAGIVATGVSVEDLRVAASAVNRFEVKNTAAGGGFHVQVSARDPELMEIFFYESNGVLATEQTRKDIDKYFNRQEVRRALLNQLGELSFPPRVNESYVEELLRHIDVEGIRSKRFRIAVDYAFSSAGLVMPALLRQLRVESFSAHSFMDPDEEAIRSADLPTFTDQCRRLVDAMGADLGVVFDYAAERIILIDERAREIPADKTLHLLLRLVARHSSPGGQVLLPANASMVAADIVEREGLEVVRGRISAAGLMEEAARDRVLFAGSPDGGFIFPDVIAGYDAVLSLAKVLELLVHERKPLSELRDAVPAAALVHERAPVPWSMKGMVMRELNERIREGRIDLADGIKVEDDAGGWAQFVPDPDEPLFHIYAEGQTSDESAEIMRRYRALFEDVLQTAEA
jgi:mannose-1-phosphate guanylyltransferase / phosphomannomutase